MQQLEQALSDSSIIVIDIDISLSNNVNLTTEEQSAFDANQQELLLGIPGFSVATSAWGLAPSLSMAR
ncbi:hypothetical protein DPMN_176102 [Dreissena polymorpha]|uniref:Uncharacterized protein n=1 Tax=Dreissena polymorpha TaxID=45954 RepID=A0A9D4IGM2_DREPO|nr:hypothetical protein DPMN_176102 [Dreissena polymorpha]